MGNGDSPTNMEEWIKKMEKKERDMTKKEGLEKEVSERNRRERLWKFYKSEIFTGGDTDKLVTPEKVSMRGRSRSPEEQEMKEASLLHFLRRSGKSLQSHLKDLRQVSNKLKDAWEELGYPWEYDVDTNHFVREFDDLDHFVRMMLLNGAFLLEFMRTERELLWAYLHVPNAWVNPIMRGILEDHDETKRYHRDFLLIGNQLPPMLLDTLIMVGYSADSTNMGWIGYLLKYGETFLPIPIYKSNIYKIPQIQSMYDEFKSSLHILDLYRRCLMRRDFKRAKTKRRESQEEFHSMNNIPSATALHSVGIEFAISGSLSRLDICLRGKTLMLPEIVIDGSTRSSFFNLITFEKLHKDVAKNEVTSYLYFIGCLVLVADDASLLQSCGIIVTTLPPAEVADLFHKMIKDISLDRDDPLAPEIIEAFAMVRERHNKMAAEWRKDLFQTYLKSPWAILSVVTAILLFYSLLYSDCLHCSWLRHPK